MTSLLSLTSTRPTRMLGPGEVLIVQGEGGGDMFVLESGVVSVVRDGIEIARIDQPGTLIGEMSVLLGIRNSASVRAESQTRVRVIRNAMQMLENDASLALRVAALVAGRLNATSGLLVELTKQSAGRPAELGMMGQILKALHVPGKGDA